MNNGFETAPQRYTQQERETIDRIRDRLGDIGFRAFCEGTIIRYRDRAGAKGDPEGDEEKARWYEQMLAHVERTGPDPRSARPGFWPYKWQSDPSSSYSLSASVQALAAITHFLNLRQQNPNLAHYVDEITQTFELMVQAEAALTCQTIEHVREKRAVIYSDERAAVLELEYKVEVLEEMLESRGCSLEDIERAMEKSRALTGNEEYDKLLQDEPHFNEHTWRSGNQHFLLRDDGPTQPAHVVWDQLSVETIHRITAMPYPHSLSFVGRNCRGHAIYKREGDTSEQPFVMVSEFYAKMLEGLDLKMGDQNPGMISGMKDGESVIILMSMAGKAEDGAFTPVKSYARLCTYSEVAHLILAGRKEGIITEDEFGITQWFGYEIEGEGMVSAAAVKKWPSGTFYFCAAYTVPHHRAHGFGHTLMLKRAAYVARNRAHQLVVHSRKPQWYVNNGWQFKGFAPSGASILHCYNPSVFLDRLEETR